MYAFDYEIQARLICMTLIILNFVFQGTEVVEVILFNISEIGDLYLSSDCFKSMTNLRCLHITNNINDFYLRCELYTVHLLEGLEWLSDKLRHLYWDSFPLESLPSTFCAKWLVQLSMTHIKLRKLWDGIQVQIN
jgi:hypothetical protein